MRLTSNSARPMFLATVTGTHRTCRSHFAMADLMQSLSGYQIRCREYGVSEAMYVELITQIATELSLDTYVKTGMLTQIPRSLASLITLPDWLRPTRTT